MRGWLISVITGLAGLGAGFWLGRAGGGAVAAPVSVAAAVAGPHAPADPGTPVTLEDFRRVVREELNARAPAVDARPHPAAAAAPDAAQSVAAARASATFEAALARRAWTEADSEAVRDDLGGMSQEQRTEWLRQFSMAVNQGRLVPETERAPF